MTELFGRNVSVVVGKRGQTGRQFDDYRISFDVPMTAKKFPNKAKVEVYNIDQKFSGQLDDEDLVLQLFAGYGDTPGLIFSGEIRKGRATTSRNGPDLITRFECSGGGRAFRSARISKSWERGTTMKTVLTDLAKSFGTSFRIPPNIEDVQLESGFSAFGPSRDVMDTLTESLGLDWFPENDEIKVLEKNSDLGTTAVVISSSTGLINDVEKTNKGISFTTLLNPRLTPRRVVDVRGDFVKGFYMIQKVQHRGDSGFSREFYTKVEAKAIG